MPFEIRGTTPFMRDGDRIAATLVVTSDRTWLEDVRVAATADGGAGDRIPTASRAEAGALVPPLPLRNQDDRAITLRDFDGRVLVLTFIYTRCPLPDACPLMVSHLENVRRKAGDAAIGDRVAFLAVTLDPVVDTPATLRAYGEAMLAGADRFSQWTLATGTEAQVAAVTGFFGVGYKAADGLIAHSMVTAVVGPEGRVIRVFPSNSWTPTDVYTLVERETQRVDPR
jgi:protein SCO1/2